LQILLLIRLGRSAKADRLKEYTRSLNRINFNQAEQSTVLRKPAFQLIILLASLMIQSGSSAAPLVIAANPVDGKQRTVFNDYIQAFRVQHPNIKVVLQIQEHENFKSYVRNNIAKSPAIADLIFWFGGASLREFADKRLVRSLSALWNENGWHSQFTRAATDAVSWNGEQYGLPIYYYHWGVYYRRSIFDRLDLEPPTTWRELINLSQKLLENEVKPFTLGTKNHWTAAGWFDYLNLRLNGLAFHRQLLSGCIPFSDERVRDVFVHWQQILQAGFFIPQSDQFDWRDSLPFLYHGQAAMILMGNFFLGSVPEKIRQDIAFFKFPEMNPDIPLYEDAPTDVLLLTQHSQNIEAANTFLEYMASPSVQAKVAADMNMIPTHRRAAVTQTPHIIEGARLLAEAQGLAQFFDRDTPPRFAQKALPLFTEFVNKPSKLNLALSQLEQARTDAWSGKPPDCVQPER